jgi:hypothetical protein
VRVYAAQGWGSERLVGFADTTTADVQSTCDGGPCTSLDITLPCTPAESPVDCDEVWFAGCKGCVQGEVKTTDGDPVASALVKVTTGSTAFTRLTDAQGRYCSPAAEGAVATIVATSSDGSVGGTSFVPTRASACPDCDPAETIELAPPQTGESDFDFGPCLEIVGGLTVQDIQTNGADPRLSDLDDGWVTLSYDAGQYEGAPAATLSIGIVPSGTSTQLQGLPTGYVRVVLPELPSGPLTVPVAEYEGDDQPFIQAWMQSRLGTMKGLGNESYQVDTQYDLIGSGAVTFDNGFGAPGDTVTGTIDLTLAAACAPQAASVRVLATFSVTVYDAADIYSGAWGESEYLTNAWLCDIYTFYLRYSEWDTWWEGTATADLDGAPIPVDPDSLSGTARYDAEDDSLMISYYGADTTFFVTIDHPVSGPNPVDSASLVTGSSECFWTVDAGEVLITDFTGAASDTWFSGTYTVDFVKAEFITATCPDHTVSGQFGAPVCRF